MGHFLDQQWLWEAQAAVGGVGPGHLELGFVRKAKRTIESKAVSRASLRSLL